MAHARMRTHAQMGRREGGREEGGGGGGRKWGIYHSFLYILFMIYSVDILAIQVSVVWKLCKYVHNDMHICKCRNTE